MTIHSILAIDTSWEHGSLALARGDDQSFELLEAASLTGGMFSAELVPQIAAVLARRQLHQQSIDGFAVVSGPGSFTGLRVGLAAIKGLAEVLKKPIVVVSVLEALAIESGASGRVFAALDAQRGEVFLGEYDVHPETLQVSCIGEESLVRRGALPAALPMGARVVTADLSISTLVTAGATVLQIKRPSAETIARIGLRKLLAGQTISAENLDANYVRRSAAEIFSTPGS